MKPDLVCLADVDPRSVSWLWEPFIPTGMLSMTSGDPAAGKSFIALALAAGLSRGRLPDGRETDPASTIYMTCENPIAESIRPRFDMLGGDPSRLFVLKGIRFEEYGKERQGAVTLADISVLDAVISDRGARLVIADPVQSFLGAGVDLNRSNQTRPILDGLAKLAESHSCAVNLIRHLNKQGRGKPIHRGLGGIDLSGAVRSEMLAGCLPDDPQTRALVHIKSNVGPMGKTMGYSIDGEGRFSWTGESPLTAADLLAEPAGRGDRKLAEATQWLTGLVGTGAREQQEIRELAQAAGISNSTLRRAKNALEIRSYKSGMRGPWMWALLEDDHDPAEGAQ